MARREVAGWVGGVCAAAVGGGRWWGESKPRETPIPKRNSNHFHILIFCNGGSGCGVRLLGWGAAGVGVPIEHRTRGLDTRAILGFDGRANRFTQEHALPLNNHKQKQPANRLKNQKNIW